MQKYFNIFQKNADSAIVRVRSRNYEHQNKNQNLKGGNMFESKKGETMNIGTLKKVELRELWSREDKDFTNWLNDNLDKLWTAINLELEGLESNTEVSLEDSGFKVDIVVTTTKEEQIIIENQLEKTDHKHLGQIMTYMINMEAKVAVWIAKEVREEHVRVISWLNEFTDKDFYLIQMESYQIDDSKPAPFFKVICKPSKEMEEIGKQKKKINETKELKLDFWKTLFEDNKEQMKGFTKPSASTCIYNYNFHKDKDIYLNYRINKDKGGIYLVFAENFKTQFLSLRKEWESELGFSLEFKDSNVEGGSFDKCEFLKWFDKGGYRNPKAEWKEIQEEMVNNMIKLEKLLEAFLSSQKLSNKVA